MSETKNGNEQLNAARESVNEKVSKYNTLGKAKRVIWNKKRRFRTI